jgi:hypothetical protein
LGVEGHEGVIEAPPQVVLAEGARLAACGGLRGGAAGVAKEADRAADEGGRVGRGRERAVGGEHRVDGAEGVWLAGKLSPRALLPGLEGGGPDAASDLGQRAPHGPGPARADVARGGGVEGGGPLVRAADGVPGASLGAGEVRPSVEGVVEGVEGHL